MAQALKIVHVYIEDDADVVYAVPVGQPGPGLLIQARPAERCDVSGDRAEAIKRLASTIDRVAAASEKLRNVREFERWDGNDEQLWQSNRLFMTIAWRNERVIVTERGRLPPPDGYHLPEWEDIGEDRFPTSISSEQLAELVLSYLDEE
ncbi:MAG TPA: hypothetical protein VFS21_10420 [Roseiflexaceae bacterium]|nr:hypothetical protein [Roseiflexaceae bacterium]